MNADKIQLGGEMIIAGCANGRSMAGQLICDRCRKRISRCVPEVVVHPRAATRQRTIVDLVHTCSPKCAAEMRAAIAEREARLAKLDPRDQVLRVQARLLEALRLAGDGSEAA